VGRARATYKEEESKKKRARPKRQRKEAEDSDAAAQERAERPAPEWSGTKGGKGVMGGRFRLKAESAKAKREIGTWTRGSALKHRGRRIVRASK